MQAKQITYIIVSKMKAHHHFWAKLGKVHPVIFLGVAVVCGVVCVFALRANNEHMVQLRDKLYLVDQDGGDVYGALKDLQQYVVAHMNTSLTTGNTGVYPPIQLKGTYDRLVQARSAEVAKTNSALYTQAQQHCESTLAHSPLSARVACTEDYLVHSSTVKLKPIPDSLYKFNFISPRWSPDLAGWTMLATLFFIALAPLSFITRKWFR